MVLDIPKVDGFILQALDSHGVSDSVLRHVRQNGLQNEAVDVAIEPPGNGVRVRLLDPKYKGVRFVVHPAEINSTP